MSEVCSVCGNAGRLNRLLGKPLCTENKACLQAAMEDITQRCAGCKKVVRDGSLTLWSGGQLCTRCSAKKADHS